MSLDVIVFLTKWERERVVAAAAALVVVVVVGGVFILATRALRPVVKSAADRDSNTHWAIYLWIYF